MKSWHFKSLFGSLCCAILYYTILYYTILYYTILRYTILYYTILYYTTIYFAIPLFQGVFGSVEQDCTATGHNGESVTDEIATATMVADTGDPSNGIILYYTTLYYTILY